jgi:hypothetical protein
MCSRNYSTWQLGPSRLFAHTLELYELFCVLIVQCSFGRGSSRWGEKSHDTHVTGIFRRVTNETEAFLRTQEEH